jgi:cytochrome c553
MSAERVFSRKNPWFTASVGLTVAIACVAAIVGFVWLPYAQPNFRPSSLWDAICGAAGVPRARSDALPVVADFVTSKAIVTSGMFDHPSALSIGRGATLALQCEICHGVVGVGKADAPSLAGQYPDAIYKELKDFKDGARSSSVMTPLAAVLSDSDMRDLAAYYAYLPRVKEAEVGTKPAAPHIVRYGSPLHNIPACGSCHDGQMAGAPWLKGQPSAYLEAQLAAFANGGRHNDIDEQMRNIARRMTAAEIDEAAVYYGSPK